MSALLRNRGGDSLKQDVNDDEKPNKHKADTISNGDRIYMACIALLSLMLLVTLYLLRHDDEKLGVAERRIKDLRRHVR